MGARAGLVVCVTSFLLGTLFTHWIADSLTLWKSPVTDENLWTAASYYSILAAGPSVAFYFLGTVVALGGAAILWSLGDGEASNLMFDNGSIFLYGTAIWVYGYSAIPNLLQNFSSVPAHPILDVVPQKLRESTLELASNNLVASVALTGVLALQTGRWWAERADTDDQDAVAAEQADDEKDARRKRRKERVEEKGPKKRRGAAPSS
ncbi:hypothetical protein HWV62_30113 [Athelia sp. TMB]|nr:hypothetical protein HWV62_30113 [Athelia sp. TMB]